MIFTTIVGFLLYSKTWQSKEEALRLLCEDLTESFKGLTLYCWVLKDKSLSMVTAIETDDEDYFFILLCTRSMYSRVLQNHLACYCN